MTIKQVIRLLETHNKWRKGADIPMIDVKKLTQAIEIAVKELKLIAKYKQRSTTTVVHESFMDDHYLVTKCCGIPITKENFCPECGRKIIKLKHQ